jgi:hypothetical protein
LKKPHIEKDNAFSYIGGIRYIAPRKITADCYIRQPWISLPDGRYQSIQVGLRRPGGVNFLLIKFFLNIFPAMLISLYEIMPVPGRQFIQIGLVLLLIFRGQLGKIGIVLLGRIKVLCLRTQGKAREKTEKG